MFNSRLIEDTIHETIGKIFRVPHEGRPVTCFEMAGMPSEVVNSVCSVLARLAFDMALLSEGKFRLLVLCEEAHRYMPSDPRLGFAPTRHAMSRIAKEGRKYGCYLGVVSQRPGELDPTILSQCSTLFAMRLANEHDQAIIRSAIAEFLGIHAVLPVGDGPARGDRLRRGRRNDDAVQVREGPGHPAAGRRQEGRQQRCGGKPADVDLASIVERLRNVPKVSAAATIGEPVSPVRQAGASEFRRPRCRNRGDRTGMADFGHRD